MSDMLMSDMIGKEVTRLDALDKVTGAAKFTTDIMLPNLAVGKFLRSPYAHAKILSIDTSEAERLPGVYAVVTNKDMPDVLYGLWVKDQTVFARDRVRYIGEEIAAVAAVNERVAEQAVELIKVEYEELPAVFNAMDAMSQDAPVLHSDMDTYRRLYPDEDAYGNVCSIAGFDNGNAAEAFKECDLIIEKEFETKPQHHQSLESHVVTAYFDTHDHITVWTSGASAFIPAQYIGDTLKMPLTKVRVIVPYVGGSFGGKAFPLIEPHVAALAKKARRPVRIWMTGEEELTGSNPRNGAIIKIKMGFKKDGTYHAVQARMYFNTGAYAADGPGPVDHAAFRVRGCYKCPNADIKAYCVYTNRIICGAFRGYGNPQVNWATEQMFDIAAEKLGMDPHELRMKNFTRTGDTLVSGQIITSNAVHECMDLMLKNHKFVNESHGPVKKVTGTVAYEHCSGLLSSGAVAMINPDGTLKLLVGSCEIGSGQKTTLGQIAAATLGIPIEQISLAMSDSEITPFDYCTCASRVTFCGGNAVKRAVEDAKEQLLKLAGKLCKVEPEELEVKDGRIINKNTGEQVTDIQEIGFASHYYEHGPIIGRGTFYAPEQPKDPSFHTKLATSQWPTFMYGTQAIDIEVDEETGVISVTGLTAATDVGRVIDPARVQGQIAGGFIQGMGYALIEEIKFDSGKVITQTMIDYKVPTIMDVPRHILSIPVESIDPDGPFGAKGIGEAALVPVAAGIANGVARGLGIRLTDLPMTPEKVLKALEER